MKIHQIQYIPGSFLFIISILAPEVVVFQHLLHTAGSPRADCKRLIMWDHVLTMRFPVMYGVSLAWSISIPKPEPWGTGNRPS